VRDQCVSANVPFFFKGWGEWAPAADISLDEPLMYKETPHARYHALPQAQGGGMLRVGKKKAGRLLDETVWNQMPGDQL